MMKLSLFSLAIVLGVSGMALAAQAADNSSQVAMQPQTPSAATTAQQSLDAFRANVNPTMVVPTTGPYDTEDQYVNPKGYPLGGWKEIGNPPQ